MVRYYRNKYKLLMVESAGIEPVNLHDANVALSQLSYDPKLA